jgi:hypothetical protein
MKIEAELVELWCAEMHNRDTCKGQYYSEDEWSHKVYAQTAEELHQKILDAMELLDLDSIDITRVYAIQYEDKYYLNGDGIDADIEFMKVMNISGNYLSSNHFEYHPENVARLEREKIAKQEREERKKQEVEKEREKVKRESEERKAKAEELQQSEGIKQLIELANAQGLKVEIK